MKAYALAKDSKNQYILDKENNTFVGSNGNETIDGGAGDDKIYGRDGNDSITGGDGDDTLIGGIGNDVLIGDEENDLLFGGAGHDYLSGGSQDDDLFGDDGHDVLFGDDGDDILDGGSGDDTLIGGAGHDLLIGSSGDDMLYGGAQGDDTLIGGEGDDSYYFLPEERGDNVIYDVGGSDTIVLEDFDKKQLRLRKIGTDLEINHANLPADKITIKEWFSHQKNQIEVLAYREKNASLDDAIVYRYRLDKMASQLVENMALFSSSHSNSGISNYYQPQLVPTTFFSVL